MAGRKVPKEVQAMFDKYIQNNVRRLKREDALKMFEAEFSLNEEQANYMFDTFDKDKNGILSIWEFQQFYVAVGDSALDMVNKFQELDKDGSGKLDPIEAREALKAITVAGGRELKDKEIDFFLKNATFDDDLIDLGEFATLLYRLKMYKPKK